MLVDIDRIAIQRCLRARIATNAEGGGLRTEQRPREELPARYGGEVAVLMPGLTAEMAMQRAERLLNLASPYLPQTGREFRSITVSIGVAHHRAERCPISCARRPKSARPSAKGEMA
jgi:GGDEF domain-containing protein